MLNLAIPACSVMLRTAVVYLVFLIVLRLAALREHGIVEMSGVEMAVLETDGTISVVPTRSEVRRAHPLANQTDADI